MHKTVIETKDAILQSIDVEDPYEAIRNIKKIVNFLELASGFFVELMYCYKALEIIERCYGRLNLINASIFEDTSKSEFQYRLNTLRKEYHEAHFATKGQDNL